MSVELLIGEFYTYLEHIIPITVLLYFMDSYTGNIFHHHCRSPMISKIMLGKKAEVGTSETWHILASNSFHNGFYLVSGPQWVNE